jgi:outer membrane protein assembly factor BamA
MMNGLRFFALLLILAWHPATLLAAPSASRDPNATTQQEQVKKIPIEVKGLERLDPEEMLKVLGAEIHPWYEFWADHTPKIPVKLIAAIPDTLRGWLDSKGYYDATFKMEKRPDRVIVTVHEGEPVTVGDINVSSDFPIEDYITFEKGDPFETERFIDIKKKIKNALLKEGYCSYDLDTKAYVDLAKRRVALVYRLKKGGLCHFGNTTVVEKPEDMRDAVILSRMRYRPGDIFTTERINESYAALNELGVFGRTMIDTQIKYFNEVRPRVSVAKREKLHRYTLGVGYDTKVGLRLKGTYDQFDFLGDGRKLGLAAQYSSKQKELSLSFFQPALFSWGDRYINFETRDGYYERSYEDYKERRFSLDGWLNYADGFWTIDLGAALQRIRIGLTNPTDEVIPGDFNLGYGYLKVKYDRRDSKVAPSKGYYLAGYLESGYSMGVTQNDPYYIATLEEHYIHTFGHLTLAEVGRVGVLDDKGRAALPASKFFYAGGSYSNRAYGDREIGITDSSVSDESAGGRTWLNFTAEAKYPIWGDLYGGVFYDATMISRDSYDFSGHWIQSAGAGVRYATPIGPLKLDFAVNIHDPSIRRFSIMIGESF